MDLIWIREYTQTEAYLKVHSDAAVWSYGCLCNLLTANSPLLQHTPVAYVILDETQPQSWQILSEKLALFWFLCLYAKSWVCKMVSGGMGFSISVKYFQSSVFKLEFGYACVLNKNSCMREIFRFLFICDDNIMRSRFLHMLVLLCTSIK